MKALLLLSAAMLWQMGAVSDGSTPAEPRHMQFQRAIEAPAGSAGQTCAAMDANVYAHAASESLNDVRLYAQRGTVAGIETPFALTESETQRAEAEPAQVRNLGTSGGDVVFDLAMPQRAYTAVVLDLSAKDFLATARVSGSDGQGGKSTDQGSFALFDLSSQHLSRSTTLPLQESTFPLLHVALHLTAAPGAAAHEFGPAIVGGASVPPSREAQTIYTTVAQTASVTQRGRESVATIRIPAHIPVERVSFVLDSAFANAGKNFLRAVDVTARPDAAEDSAAVETLSGEISRVRMPQGGSGIAIDSRRLSVDASLGANLRRGATVEVAVENGDDAPLLIIGVVLEMRQRRICFDAAAGTTYTLMYGDAALHAPLYDYARLFVAGTGPIAAALGPEQRNASFVARADARPYTERHPELLWIVLLAVIAVLGSVALRTAKRQGRPHQ